MTAGLITPVSGFTVEQGFAGAAPQEPAGYLSADGLKARFVPITGGTYHRHLHGAQDIACPIGTPVVAPESGIIVAAGEIARFSDGSIDGEHYMLLQINRGTVNQTILEFTHLSKFIAKLGAHVRKGMLIALTGNSGRSTGPHIHWQICYGPRTSSPAAVVWGRDGTRVQPAACMQGGVLADRGFLVPNV